MSELPQNVITFADRKRPRQVPITHPIMGQLRASIASLDRESRLDRGKRLIEEGVQIMREEDEALCVAYLHGTMLSIRGS